MLEGSETQGYTIFFAIVSAKNHIFFITKPVSGIRFKNICLYIKKNSYIFVHMSSVKAYEGGGLSALADMFSKNVRFF